MEELNKEYFERKLKEGEPYRRSVELKWAIKDAEDEANRVKRNTYVNKHVKSRFHKFGADLSSYAKRKEEMEWAKEQSFRDLIKLQNLREHSVLDIMREIRRDENRDFMF